MTMAHRDFSRGSPVLPLEESSDAPSGQWAEGRSGAADIQRLAGQSPGIDARAYFDCRERAALEAAMAAWPFLVRLLELKGETAPDAPAPAGLLRE